jgi:hypothetical protein
MCLAAVQSVYCCSAECVLLQCRVCCCFQVLKLVATAQSVWLQNVVRECYCNVECVETVQSVLLYVVQSTLLQCRMCCCSA